VAIGTYESQNSSRLQVARLLSSPRIQPTKIPPSAVTAVSRRRPRMPLWPLILLLLGIVAGWPNSAQAQSGWLPTTWFTKQKIDPEAMFPLSERDGPWLVLATTFRGPGARDDARRLVQELRGRFKMQAYTHEQAFDFTGAQRGLGLNPDGSPKRMRYANAQQVVEVAVMVGDFASCDDSRAQKTLASIKSLQPETLTGEQGKSRAYADFRRMIGLDKQEGKGPMRLAFMIPNPLLPEDYFNRPQLDEFVVEINSDVEHSLLACRGNYSVRVATFTGVGTFTDQEASGGEESEFESRLVEAAEKAHRLTEALRQQGWQAWEFHDRESSMVCVGSLSQLVIEQQDGSTQPHPELVRITAALGPDPEKLATGTILPRRIDGILLDVQPRPIAVPQLPVGRR
jgi:hypothetical protein